TAARTSDGSWGRFRGSFLMDCRQSGGNLAGNVKRDFGSQPTIMFDVLGQRFAFDKFHRIEELPPTGTQMKNRSNIRMAHPGRGSGLAEKALPRRFVFEQPRIQ